MLKRAPCTFLQPRGAKRSILTECTRQNWLEEVFFSGKFLSQGADSR